ncbi:hypothetical protein GOP47_0015284, partial [Adiantum capillus-veneris]
MPTLPNCPLMLFVKVMARENRPAYQIQAHANTRVEDKKITSRLKSNGKKSFFQTEHRIFWLEFSLALCLAVPWPYIFCQQANTIALFFCSEEGQAGSYNTDIVKARCPQLIFLSGFL